MYKKYYTVEWAVALDDEYCYTDRKRFEADEEAKMSLFIFDLTHKEGIRRIWKNTFEEILSY